MPKFNCPERLTRTDMTYPLHCFPKMPVIEKIPKDPIGPKNISYRILRILDIEENIGKSFSGSKITLLKLRSETAGKHHPRNGKTPTEKGSGSCLSFSHRYPVSFCPILILVDSSFLSISYNLKSFYRIKRAAHFCENEGGGEKAKRCNVIGQEKS